MTAAPALPSYVSGVSDAPLLGDTIGDNLDRTVVRHGDREALVDCASGRRWTYSQLRVEVDAMARGLLAAGIGKGDRVGIWAPNCAEWLLVQYSTAKIGAILVTINPAYQTSELEYVVNHAGIRMLVAAKSFKNSDYAAMISEMRPRCAALQQVVLIGSGQWDALAVRDGDAWLLADIQSTLSPDDPINIQYTSGTTGFPKGATLSHHNILNNGYFVGELCGYTEADRICVPVPLSITVLEWSWAIWLPPRTARAWCIQRRHSTRRRPCRPSRSSGARRCMGCPPCSSPCWPTPASSRTTSRRCGRGSWRARRARCR